MLGKIRQSFLCLACLPYSDYAFHVKTLTIRLPDSLLTEIEQESQARRISKSDVARDWLRQRRIPAAKGGSMRDLIGDLMGSVKGLPSDLSSNKQKHLPGLIRAKKLHRG